MLLAIAITGCARQRPLPKDDLVFLTRGACVNTAAMRGNFDAALKDLGLPAEYQFVDIDTLPNTDRRTGYPTPTVLFRDHDLFDLPQPVPPFPEPA
jgi:hypothetical protein